MSPKRLSVFLCTLILLSLFAFGSSARRPLPRDVTPVPLGPCVTGHVDLSLLGPPGEITVTLVDLCTGDAWPIVVSDDGLFALCPINKRTRVYAIVTDISCPVFATPVGGFLEFGQVHRWPRCAPDRYGLEPGPIGVLPHSSACWSYVYLPLLLR